MGAIKRQSIRTGGWANPSRMAERKFKDTLSQSATITFGAGTFTAPAILNGLTQGSDATNRIGRKVIWKSLYLRMTAALAATSTGGGNIRCIIVYDKQANAAAPAVTDILVQDAFTSPNNLNNRDRFVTLCDQITDPIGAATEFSAHIEYFKKINLETVFNSGNAGTIGDIQSGSLYIMFAQQGTIATASGQITWSTRLRFDDP